jgi:hypothetical protein
VERAGLVEEALVNRRFNMKKTALLAVLVLALGGTRLESGIKRVDDGASFEPGIAVDGGDARTRIPFTAEYDNQIGGHWSCTGIRLTGDGSRPLTKDTEECTITDLSTMPPGTYRGPGYFFVNGTRYTWTSDYDALTAIGVNLIVTDNGDGTGHVEGDFFY